MAFIKAKNAFFFLEVESPHLNITPSAMTLLQLFQILVKVRFMNICKDQQMS